MLRAQLCTHISTAPLYIVKAVLQAHSYTYVNTDHFVYSRALLHSQLYTYLNTASLCTVRALLQAQLYTYINSDHFVYSKGSAAGTIGKDVEVMLT